MPNMNVFAKLNLKDTRGIVFSNATEYPPNPDVGQVAFVDKILSIYTEIEPGVFGWYPLLYENLPVFKHVQGIDSTTWTVEHNLDSNDLIFFVYDDDNNLITPNNFEFVDADTLTLSFNTMLRGKAFIFSYETKFIGVGGGSGSGGPVELGPILDFQKYSISNINYNGDDTINEIIFTTGNRQTLEYVNGSVVKTNYYDIDGTTLLLDQTFTYDGFDRIISVTTTKY